MAIESTKSMNVARCDDNPHCQWVFRSACARGVFRAQLVAAGAMVVGPGSAARVLCPRHKPQPLDVARMPSRRNW